MRLMEIELSAHECEMMFAGRQVFFFWTADEFGITAKFGRVLANERSVGWTEN